MDVRRLRYLAAVHDHGGFAQAAAALHVTQPAISMAIRKLEEELGQVLVERRARPPELTGFGLAAYRSWQVHVAEQQRLQRELRGMADLNAARVSLVLGATFPLRPVLAALAALRRRFPGFRLDLAMGGYTGFVPALVEGSVDMILSQLPARGPDPRLAYEPLVLDRFRAVCHCTHPLAGRRDLDWGELAGHAWAGGGPFDAFLPGWSEVFAAHGAAPPDAVLYTNSIVATMAAVAGHGFLAMLPEDCISEELASGSVGVLPLPGLEWPQEKGVSWFPARAMTHGARAWLDELEANVPD